MTPPSPPHHLPGEHLLFGIVDFLEGVTCTPSVLGYRDIVVMGGITGFLEFPSLPDWSIKPDHPLDMPLVPPKAARDWKRGDELIFWGRPSRYPSGISDVERVLVEFPVKDSEFNLSANNIWNAFTHWRSLFSQYLELITKQSRTQNVRSLDNGDGIDLFSWTIENTLIRPHKLEPSTIIIREDGDNTALTRDQLIQILSYCNKSIAPGLAYRVQLEAYRALRIGDYRKAIIETAVATESALTKAIKKSFYDSNLDYGEKLLGKFRMLGGRIELARIIGVSLPRFDYQTLLLNPRNNVIHQADFANEDIARSAINAVDELLALLSPSIGEDE